MPQSAIDIQIMRSMVSSSAVLAAASVVSSLLAAEAFTSSIQTRQYHHQIPKHQLSGKKKGNFLDEFADELPKSEPIQVKIPGEDDFHNDLLAWLETNKLTYINPKFKILPSQLGGYGGFCSSSPEKIMKKNEMILCIPRELCITFDDALNDPKCGDAFQFIKEYQLPDWELMLVAGWAAKEYLMGGLMEDKSNIKHWPYLNSIPWKRGELDQEHVLFWSDEEVETLLEGSFAYEDAQLIRSRVQNATKLLDDRVFGSLLRQEMGLEASEPIPGLKEAVTATFIAFCLEPLTRRLGSICQMVKLKSRKRHYLSHF